MSEFLFKGNERGVVLLHGFTGAPATVRYLGERLAARGMTVYAPLLPGHGGSAEALAASTAAEWESAALAAVDKLRQRCEYVAVVGLSMGGLLALRMAMARPVCAVVTIATPLWLDLPTTWLVRLTHPRWLGRWIKELPKRSIDVRQAAPGSDEGTLHSVPTRALAQFARLMKGVRAQLALVTTPLLVLHSVQDHTAPVACALELAQAARAERLRIFENSYHLLASDVDRDEVADEVAEFLLKHTQPPRRASRV